MVVLKAGIDIGVPVELMDNEIQVFVLGLGHVFHQ